MEFKELINRYQIAISTVYRKVNQIMKEKVHEDITTDQFATLQYIYQQEACTSTDIAHAFGVGKSAITNQVNRLHKKGLIIRNQDETDRRNIFLHVTADGKEIVEFTEKELTIALTPLLSQFKEEEIYSFIHSLERLANLLEGKDFNQ